MAANNDTAMTRFLFAILKQKCLKDIDWNKVAHDPILTQEITNGHAARMRYSRFRSSMLGLEPQRRNRTGAAKSKVTKSKKDVKARKEEPVKEDPAGETATTTVWAGTPQEHLKQAQSPEVKQEASQMLAESQPPPLAPQADSHTHIHPRLLTPCSDTDLLATSHGYAMSPSSDILQSDPTFDFSSAAAAHCTHEHASWPHATSYPTFSMPYELDSFAAGFCEHQHAHHHAEGLCVPSAVMDPDPAHVAVKHEEWDTQYHEV